MNVHDGDLPVLETEDVRVAVVHHLGKAQGLHDDHDALSTDPLPFLQRQLGDRFRRTERRPPGGEDGQRRTVALVLQAELLGCSCLELDRVGRLADADLVPESAGNGIDADAGCLKREHQRVGGFVGAD